MSDGRGQQAGSGGRRRYRVAGSGDWAAGLSPEARIGDGGDDHVADLAAGYVLDALELAEREQVERHARSCPSCAKLLAADARVAGFLPYLAPAVVPAPDVKAALFARIAHAERAATVETSPRPIASHAQTLPSSRSSIPAGSVSAADSSAVPSMAGPTRRRSPLPARAGSFLSVPLLLALAAVGAWGIQMRGQAAEADARLGAVQAQFANFAAGQTYDLRPGEAGPGAEGSLLVSEDQRQVLLSMQVNNPKRDRIYQLLVNDGERIVPKADIEVGPDGRAQKVVDLDRPYSEYESFEVKAKPASGDAAAGSGLESIVLSDVTGSIGDTEPGVGSVAP